MIYKIEDKHMNIKNIIIFLTIGLTISLITNTMCVGISSIKQYPSELSELQKNLDAVNQKQYPETDEGKKQKDQDIINALSKYNQATQPKIKPTDPDAFYHEYFYKGLDAENYNFFFKPIFFGKDADGKDCYRRIIDHMENPEFGKVKLIVLNKNTGYTPLSKESLETLGTYSDINIPHRFLKKASKSQGGVVWCPLKNAFVAGIGNTKICDEDLEKDFIILEKKYTQN